MEDGRPRPSRMKLESKQGSILMQAGPRSNPPRNILMHQSWKESSKASTKVHWPAKMRRGIDLACSENVNTVASHPIISRTLKHSS